MDRKSAQEGWKQIRPARGLSQNRWPKGLNNPVLNDGLRPRAGSAAFPPDSRLVSLKVIQRASALGHDARDAAESHALSYSNKGPEIGGMSLKVTKSVMGMGPGFGLNPITVRSCQQGSPDAQVQGRRARTGAYGIPSAARFQFEGGECPLSPVRSLYIPVRTFRRGLSTPVL